MGSMSKLYIPFNDYTSIGGPATFMSNLRAYLDMSGFMYTGDASDKCSIFFPISYDIDKLDSIKRNGGKIIQRLDGIYYPSKHGDKYIDLNRSIKEVYLNYADHVIFQSEYSKNQCFSIFGSKPEGFYTLIVNGVDKKIFRPNRLKIKLSKKIEFITTGNFRNIDMIEPVVLALDSLLEAFNFRLHVVGPVVNDALKSIFKRNYIVMHGPKSLRDVASLLRKSDIYIYSHLNPPCPNSVIEAISCGLPIVGFNSGAMGELTFFSRELLANVSNEVFQKYEDFDYRKLAEKIALSVEKYGYYRKNADAYSDLYSFDECGKKYTELFKRYF